MTFQLLACQFQLSARRVIHFPPWGAGNVLRGALGSALREIASAEDCARIFQPKATRVQPTGIGVRPSGLSDLPRPFVIRAAALNGRSVQPGERFCFSLHLFDLRDPALHHFTQAFERWADLIAVDHSRIEIDLSPGSQPVSRVRATFRTPTDLKLASRGGNAEFSPLLARARDRLSTLRSLYGTGPLEIDFRALAERARSVQTVRSQLQRIAVQRRSSRTGQRHDIGGFVGCAEYEGELAEFLPYLDAASWTGVGRHCTWGNGHIAAEVID